MGAWENGVWNMVFVGSKGAPPTHCGNDQGSIPSSNIEATPVIAEKPYLVAENDKFLLMKPKVEFNKVGNTPGF